jgi:hypothetical protein
VNALESFLIGKTDGGDLPAEFLADPRLASFFYSALPEDHPARAAFQNSFLAANARHAVVKSRVQEVVRAWNEAGIVPLLFGGFAMAEFVYDQPGTRFYGNVVVLVHERDAARAAKIVSELPDWVELWNRSDTVAPSWHEQSRLFTRDSTVRLDLYRFVVPNDTVQTAQAQKMTEQVWESSSERDWDGLRIRMASPEDSVLVGIVLSRLCNLKPEVKPYDILDFKLLVKKLGLNQAALLERAKTLGLNALPEVFFARCDPWRGQLQLGALTTAQGRVWANTFPLSWRTRWALSRLGKAFHVSLETTNQLGNVWRVKRLMRQTIDLNELLQRNESTVRSRPDTSHKYMERVVRGVRWALYLVGPRQDGCVPRSLAIFHALQAQGHKVSFVSGVRYDNGTLVGHAWVEWQGLPLDFLTDLESPLLFKENFRYPALKLEA